MNPCLVSALFICCNTITVKALAEGSGTVVFSLEHKKRIIDRVERAFAESSKLKTEENLVLKAVSTLEEKRFVYEWLRTKAKPEPPFAKHAQAMAFLARHLKVSQKELEEAEQLDLHLNKDNPETWLRRGISYAKEKNNEWAVDLFLEAVRRTDFATPPNFFWKLAPPETSWLERTVKSGRTDELSSALGTALSATKTGTARDVAASMMQAVIESADTPMRPARLQRLMEIVLKHQRHLILPRFDCLREASAALEKAGKCEMAALLARMVLLGVWPEGTINHFSYSPGSSTNNLPTGVWNAKSAWGGSTDEVGLNAVIMPVFQTALHGESASKFVDHLVNDALLRSDDEHLISCALMARALLGPLPDDALRLADKLDDQAQMRVAWRLCQHAPSQHIKLVELSPLLARGLKSIFQDKSYLGNGCRHYLLAEEVIPWLEQAGAADALHDLLPLFAQGLNEHLSTNQWRRMIVLANKHHDAAFLSLIAEKWTDQCQYKFKMGFASQEWLVSSISALAVTTQELESGQGSAFTRLADNVWHAFLKKYGGRTDPPVEAANRLCDALLASGERHRLLALAADVQRIIQLGGEPGYELALQRIRRCAEFLDLSGMRMPTAQLWVKNAAADETTAQVYWRHSADVDDTAADDVGSMRMPRDYARRGVVMQCLAGQLDLEIFAGVSPDSLSLRQTLHGVAATGSIELNNLPVSGWVCGVLRRPGTGATNFGTPDVYCLRRPLLDTAITQAAALPVWRDAWLHQYGQPVSPVIRVSDGMRLFISDASGTSERDAESHFDPLVAVALDEKHEPIGHWPLGSGMEAGQILQADGTRVLLLQPTAWIGMGGSMQLRGRGSRDDGVLPQHLVLTSSAQQERSRLPPVQVRLFTQEQQEQPSTSLTRLEQQHVADIGFKITFWHLSETLPVAAFSGAGELVVFNTTMTPWQELLRLKDNAIEEGDRLFILDCDCVCVCKLPRNNLGTGSLRLIRWNGGKSTAFEDCPEIAIPFVPFHVEMSPDEMSVIFLSGRHQRFIQTALLDATGHLKLCSDELPRLSAISQPFVAWWGPENQVVLEDDGVQFYLRRTVESLVLEQVDKGVVTLVTVPRNTRPGQRLLWSRWTLKHDDVLARIDPKTGAVLDGFKVKQPCAGMPMWWDNEECDVLLQTLQNELISVKPLVSRGKNGTQAP